MDSNRIGNGIPRAKSVSRLQKLSLTITGSLENFFYNWGFQIATRPWTFIGACLLLTLLCSIGLIGFTPEQRPDKLWIPWNSDFYKNTDWLRNNFPSPIRFHHVILTAENVLVPSFMELLAKLHNEVLQLRANHKGWEDLCFRLPVTKFSNLRRRRKRDSSNDSSSENIISKDFADTFKDDFFEDQESEPETRIQDFDPSIELPQDTYCDILNSLEDACWELNPVELWNYDESLVKSLTRSDILNTINSKTVSPVFGRAVNYSSEFGGIVRNTSGHIIQANSVILSWFARINQTAISGGDSNADLGNGETVDQNNLLWETEFVNLLTNYTLPEGVEMYFRIARSFGDISENTIVNDASNFALGFSIVFVYVMFMLGKCNLVEQRPLLALAGLSCIALAIAVSYGICSSFSLIYGPIHNVLPFLLLGIGIDDMFVIMQCWNNLPESKKGNTIPENVGLALKHAGVSITVTSVTDFAAFVIGGTTVLPALQSFCIYAAFGVIATYIFQATFFTAWLSLDMKRAQQNRNAFLICFKHDETYVASDCSQDNLAQRFLGGSYSSILFSKLSKVLIILVTFGIAGICVWGNTLLRQEFDPIWFLPQDSYLFKYFGARDKYFPGRGNNAMVIMSNVTLHTNLMEIDRLVQSLTNSKSVYDVDAWFPDFKTYVNKNFGTDIPHTKLSERSFDRYLSRFLFSPSGSKYRGRFAFEGNLTCGQRAPQVKVSSIGFKLKTFNGPEEHIPAMHEVKNFVKFANFEPPGSDISFVWSYPFAGWETDEIITAELYRNMGLAMICVLLTTLLLIANVTTCLMVLLCVILTLVDVLGGMYFWDLTIDTVSCIDLVLAIGLCVDYAAHIGHAFMTCSGTRNQRARQALRDIGPAVLNGGFSTFLAFILLANSKSHVFLTFYKIFFMVVVFGLFHGLVFLPVLLSVLGPPPYPSAEKRQHSEITAPLPEEIEQLNPAHNGLKTEAEDFELRKISLETEPGFHKSS